MITMTHNQFKTFKLLLGYCNMSDTTRVDHDIPVDRGNIQWEFLTGLVDSMDAGYIVYTEEERTVLNRLRSMWITSKEK